MAFGKLAARSRDGEPVNKGGTMLPANHEKLARRAEELRNNPTPLEQRLWDGYLAAYSLPWERQAVIGRYIVPFYCPEAGLVIELDDDRRNEGIGRGTDKPRRKFLAGNQLWVMRLTAKDIEDDFEEVCMAIGEAVILATWRPRLLPPTYGKYWKRD